MTDNMDNSPDGLYLFGMPSGNDLRKIFIHEMQSPANEKAMATIRAMSRTPMEFGELAVLVRTEAAATMTEWSEGAMRRAMQEQRIKAFDVSDVLILATMAWLGDMNELTNDAKLAEFDQAVKKAFSGAYDKTPNKE